MRFLQLAGNVKAVIILKSYFFPFDLQFLQTVTVFKSLNICQCFSRSAFILHSYSVKLALS